MCCVRAGHVAADVAARRHMIRPVERVLIIPVDRSNNSPFYCVWCCWRVHHFERAWSADTDRLQTVPLRDLTQKHSAVRSYCMRNVYNFVG